MGVAQCHTHIAHNPGGIICFRNYFSVPHKKVCRVSVFIYSPSCLTDATQELLIASCEKEV
jgi:hypothetical protein